MLLSVTQIMYPVYLPRADARNVKIKDPLSPCSLHSATTLRITTQETYHADTDAKRKRGTSACICHHRVFAHLGEVSYNVTRPYEQRHSRYESKLHNPESIANPKHRGMRRKEAAYRGGETRSRKVTERDARSLCVLVSWARHVTSRHVTSRHERRHASRRQPRACEGNYGVNH